MASSRETGRFHIKKDENVTSNTVQEFGNSLAVVIPADDVDEMGIEKGDEVGVRVTSEGCVEVLTDSS